MAPKKASATKRKREEIDLTHSDDNKENNHSQSRKSKRHDSADLTQRNSQLRTPPSSSAPIWSQASSQGQSHSEHERQQWLADDEDDVNAIMASAQGSADSNAHLFHYGDLDIKIVGVQHYHGHANPGEQILMRREPGNPYDSNAIRIDNVSRNQIGHVPRKMAEKLSKYIDNQRLSVEGRISGYKGSFDCPLKVHLYGPDPSSEVGQEIIEEMKADKLPIQGVKAEEQKRKKALTAARKQAASGKSEWAATPTTGNGENVVMDDVVEASQRFDTQRLNSGEAYGVNEVDLENMPMAAKPKAIKTEMLPYQLQALQWLLDQENPKPPSSSGPENAVQLWQKNGGSREVYTNLATNHTTDRLPPLASGGILADDMGLGKTLEMISLMIADAENSGRGTTLIVSPLSVMSNWSGQIAHHVHDEHALKVYTYHGQGRVDMSASDFGEYDVVITTYQTLASDYMPRGKDAKKPSSELRKKGLYSMNWRRIILDEGHTVRNPQSKGAAAVTAVKARSRWVLTGTPIVTSLKDLYSILRFIGVTGGLDILEVFNSVLVRPLKDGDEAGVALLKAIMKAFTLRRRKDMKFIDLRLPELKEYLHRIEFTSQERKRYDALTKEAKGMLKDCRVKKEQRDGKTGTTFHYLLEILLRMRQCCNHWRLCSERITDLLSQLEAQKTVDLTPENMRALQDMLQIQIESQEDCAICLEPLHDPVITNCGHSFGRSCISEVIDRQHKCPMCRAVLKDEECLVAPKHDCGDEDAASDNATSDQSEENASSSKLDALLKIIQASKSGSNKTIVFSQWTRFLDIVQKRLEEDGYKFCRLDGTMNAGERDAALKALERDPDTTVMLASLGVCAVGLNLTAANQIILSDTRWAPAIEDQAVDRVHRLGQKRETRVFRLVMDGSIEDKTLAIQKTKRELMNLAFSEKGGKRDNARQGRLADIEQLLQ